MEIIPNIVILQKDLFIYVLKKGMTCLNVVMFFEHRTHFPYRDWPYGQASGTFRETVAVDCPPSKRRLFFAWGLALSAGTKEEAAPLDGVDGGRRRAL